MTAHKNRIFIVDDHPLVREGLATLINGQDDLIVCGGAEDSVQAIAGIRKMRPDVALIDISLKNESGLELVKNLGSQFPQVALIVLSMHDEALYAERALRAGARGYVMKRETSKSVLASIRRVLEGGVYVSQRVINRMAQRVDRSRETAASSPIERLSDRELGSLPIARPGPQFFADRRRPESEFEDGPSLLRTRERKIRRDLFD
jgi:DNA-binding NarL/FixJ family response regulator